jgi:hypothetical protein
LSGDSLSDFQFSVSMPSTNRLGSKLGLLTNASTSPLRGSMATSAAAAVAEQPLDQRLQPDVDRQHHLVARRRRVALEPPHGAAAGARLDLLEAGQPCSSCS